MNRIKNKILGAASLLYLTGVSQTLAATAKKDPTAVTILDANVTVQGVLVSVINWVLTFAGAIAVLFIIYGGFLYVTSSGNDKRVEAAKKTLTFAVIGLIVIVLAKVIVTFVVTNTAALINTK